MVTLASPRGSTPGWSRDAFFGGILLFGLLAMTARNAIDPDLWWHLRTGQWIVETGHVPHTDPFSFTRAGHLWVPHEWLSEVVFYELWKHGGAAALIIFSATITTVGFMLLYLRCPGMRHWAAAGTIFGALAAAPCWGTRPQMFTFALASLLLWLVEAGEKRPKLLLWILPLFLLWLNLHAGFALGPALLTAYGVGLLAETACGNTPWPEARPTILRVLLLVLACFALVPLNPSGTHLYLYPLETLRSSGMRSFIAEWRSPDFHQSLYRPLLVMWPLVLTALASFHSRPKGRVLAPLLLTSVAALDAVRHIPIFVLVAIPVMVASLPACIETAISGRAQRTHLRNARSPSPTHRRFQTAFNGCIVIFLALFAFAKWVSLTRVQNVREAEVFPQQAVALLRTGDYPRNIFVFYDWGGYAIWKLYPEYRVFVDGRADLYGEDLMRQSMKTLIELRHGWRDILDIWRVDALLIPPSSALAQALLLDPRWHAAFTDSKAILLLRSLPTVENAGITVENADITKGSTPRSGPKGEKIFPRARRNLRN